MRGRATAAGCTGDGTDMYRGVRVTDSGWLYAYDPVSGMWKSTYDPIPAVAPATGLHTATLLSGKAVLDSLDRRLDATRDEIAGADPRKFRLWAQGVHRNDKLSTGLHKNAANEVYGAQAGADWNYKSAGVFAENGCGRARNSRRVGQHKRDEPLVIRHWK